MTRKIGGAETHPRWRSGEIPAAAGARVVRGGLGVAPGVEARPLRCSGGAGEQQSNAAAAEQRRGEAELRRRGG